MYVFKKNNISKCYTIEEDLKLKKKKLEDLGYSS